MAIERADLEAKLRQIEEIVDETKQQAQTTGTTIAVVVVVIVVGFCPQALLNCRHLLICRLG